MTEHFACPMPGCFLDGPHPVAAHAPSPDPERDRLAADLHVQFHVSFCSREGCLGEPFWQPVADRLIDLGWTRLDEERLMRAYHASMFGDRDTHGIERCEAAHQIYEAYREDEG